MQFHIITVPMDRINGKFNTYELDEFCRHHHILYWESHFFQLHQEVYWTCWLGYERKQAPELPQPLPVQQSKTTELELTPLQTKVYEALRTWRNEHALQEGIASYLIAKNAELQQVAQTLPKTASGLLAIPGFGKKKVAKYSEPILRIIQQHASDDYKK